jgi:DNA-binding XRE family transcriptional regulator
MLNSFYILHCGTSLAPYHRHSCLCSGCPDPCVSLKEEKHRVECLCYSASRVLVVAFATRWRSIILCENPIFDDFQPRVRGRRLKLLPPWLPVSEAQVLGALAKRIKFLRRSKRWSQQQLAERASMQRSYVADLERGHRNPSVRTLLKVANAMDVPIASLFVETPKSRTP